MKLICIIKGDEWRGNLQCPLVPLLKHKLKRESGSRNLSGAMSQMGDQQKLDLCTSLSHIILMAPDEHALAQRHANPINPVPKRKFSNTHTQTHT